MYKNKFTKGTLKANLFKVKLLTRGFHNLLHHSVDQHLHKTRGLLTIHTSHHLPQGRTTCLYLHIPTLNGRGSLGLAALPLTSLGTNMIEADLGILLQLKISFLSLVSIICLWTKWMEITRMLTEPGLRLELLDAV